VRSAGEGGRIPVRLRLRRILRARDHFAPGRACAFPASPDGMERTHVRCYPRVEFHLSGITSVYGSPRSLRVPPLWNGADSHLQRHRLLGQRPGMDGASGCGVRCKEAPVPMGAHVAKKPFHAPRAQWLTCRYSSRISTFSLTRRPRQRVGVIKAKNCPIVDKLGHKIITRTALFNKRYKHFAHTALDLIALSNCAYGHSNKYHRELLRPRIRRKQLNYLEC
jgi:hypothetical protein